MRRIRLLLAVVAVTAGTLAPLTAAADPIMCHEYSCCNDVVVLGKTILNIDC